jgi:hypothetical protein
MKKLHTGVFFGQSLEMLQKKEGTKGRGKGEDGRTITPGRRQSSPDEAAGEFLKSR